MKKRMAGFTLLELLVVITIIAILVVVGLSSFGGIKDKSNDAKRQADLRMVENALSLYKQKYGRYPARCTNSHANWSGEAGTNYACNSGSEYIEGLVPEFISALPRDPRPVSGNQGYAYTVNAEGTVYKFMAKNTVESDDIGYDHPFQSCDRTNSTAVVMTTPSARKTCEAPHSTGAASVSGCDIGMCDRIYSTSNAFNRNYQNALRTNGGESSIAHCVDGNSSFETSYAVWGGRAEPFDNFYNYSGSDEITLNMLLDMSVERESEKVLCLIP